MVKRICIFLLMATLLFSLAVIVSAEVLSGDEIPEINASMADISDESGDTSQVVVVPELPDGYIVDDDFFIRLTLDAEHGWSYSIEDLLKGLETDGYVYYVEEVDIPLGYDAIYSMSGVLMESGVNIGDAFTLTDDVILTDGNVIIIKNVKEGEPPAYELPETGGIGSTPYTIAGVTVLLFTAVYGLILYHKRKHSAE